MLGLARPRLWVAREGAAVWQWRGQRICRGRGGGLAVEEVASLPGRGLSGGLGPLGWAKFAVGVIFL